MSDEHAQALQLTGDIYDAALDPGLWPEVLHQVSEFVGGPASILVSQDVAARSHTGAQGEHRLLQEVREPLRR